MALIPVLRRQKQGDVHQFKPDLVYTTRFRPTRATEEDPVSRRNKINEQKLPFSDDHVIHNSHAHFSEYNIAVLVIVTPLYGTIETFFSNLMRRYSLKKQ